MPNRLADAVSPYLRSHADNPVHWQPWGPEPFAEALKRQVPVFISIGYSTCHWCHVMARESFSDPALAGYLNENFVCIKVDREEHPDVDSSYLAAAGAFTSQLGWPLSVFATPQGKAFFAGTYFPPVPVQGRASFRQVLGAVLDAWVERREQVELNAVQLAAALSAQGLQRPGPLPVEADFATIVGELEAYEDTEFGGFGGAPKFPMANVLGFLLDRESLGDEAAGALARRALDAMAASELRDPIEGGFFRYCVKHDWTEPHYERMLYDNALLLSAYTRAGRREIAEGIGEFLLTVMRLPGGGFASAQDSESTVDGVRVEGGYYQLDAGERSKQAPPALDDKVLTGWNGLAIEALAFSGRRLGHPEWIEAARDAAELVGMGALVRARIDDQVSTALPTLEDYGMVAGGLVELALATGEARYADRARTIVADAIAAGGRAPFGVPEGGDPVLVSNGIALEVDPSEGAYPSGLSANARASYRLHLLSGEATFLESTTKAMELLAPMAVKQPVSFGAALSVMSALEAGPTQLVVISDAADAELASVARNWDRSGGVVSVVTGQQADELAEQGFELFEGRAQQGGAPTAYLCENFTCRMPVTQPAELESLLH